MEKKLDSIKMENSFIPDHFNIENQEEINEEQEEENPTAFTLLSKIEDPYYSKFSSQEIHQSEGNSQNFII